MRPIVNTKNHKKDTALTVHVSLFAFPFLSPPHPTLLPLLSPWPLAYFRCSTVRPCD